MTPDQAQHPAHIDDASAEAFLTATQQHIDRMKAAAHQPWCDTSQCMTFAEPDGTVEHDHYGPQVDEGNVTIGIEWHPSTRGANEPIIYLRGAEELEPAQARKLAAELLRMATAIEAAAMGIARAAARALTAAHPADRTQAAAMLDMWAYRDRLDDQQVAEVLDQVTLG